MKPLLTCFLTFITIWVSASPIHAIVDPQTSPNNRFGIHIFDAPELEKVKDLVNSSNGEWGYVTVPIRADDRNREKWNAFMHAAKQNKLIPLVRLATTMTKDGWTKPDSYTPIDFANFLNDLDWPVNNRYIIVYNEPNHATEWGGQVKPEEYADVLDYTAGVFKSRNDDFYILPAGLDAAAPTDDKHLNWKLFLERMHSHNPQALKQIDGWTSHSYPNPAFSGSPNDQHDHSIISFRHEKAVVESLTGKSLPIFITETGWSNQALADETIAHYYEEAFNGAWNNDQIIAVTPFVLLAGDGPFKPFSLMDPSGNPKPQYQALQQIQKTSGQPLIARDSVAALNSPILGTQDTNIPVEPKPEPILGEEKWDKIWDWVKN